MVNPQDSKRTLLALAGLVGAVVIAWLARDFFVGNATVHVQEEKTAEESRTTVELTAAKHDSEHIRVQTVARRTLRDERVIAGRVSYDEATHVKVRTPVEGRVQEIYVKPGDQVNVGDVIAVLRSPAVGDARGEVLRRMAELHVAEEKFQWETKIAENLERLIADLKQRPEPKEVEKNYEQKVLGDYRESILVSYSKVRLAETLASNLNSVAAQGAIEGRVLRERTSNREVLEAEFRGRCEQALFEAHHKFEISKGLAEDASRKLQVARNHLATLLGHDEEQIESSKLSELQVRAPIRGTIEERLVARTERVQAGDELFSVADIAKLWITADIRERDWELTKVEPGQTIAVQIPALGNATFPAKVHYVGRVVADPSHALPLVALIDNPEFHLRPGMFARVKVPLVQTARESLVIPSSALASDDKEHMVFLEEKPGRYRRVDVKVGRETDEAVEVLAGLHEGDRVVTEGTFVLKSELFLEAEE